MAQWPAAFVLAESQVEFPVPKWQLPTNCKSSPGGMVFSSDLHGPQNECDERGVQRPV
jgi:hypothetical protein